MAEVVVTIKSDISQVEANVTKLSRELRDAKLAFNELEKGTAEYTAAKSKISELTKELNKNKDAVVDFKSASIDAFKQLNIKLKEAKNNLAALTEGTPEYTKQAEEVGKLKDQINGLNDSIKTTSGAPIENLTNSFGLLSGQVSNLDFEGASSSLKQFTSAAGQLNFKTLTSGLKTFVSGLGELAVTLLTNPIFLLAGVIAGVVAGIKIYNENFSKAAIETKKLTAEVDKQKRTTELLGKELNREIALMEAQGVSADKILAKKKELIHQQIQEAIATAKLNIAKANEVQNNDSITESIFRKQAAALKALGFDKDAAKVEKALAVEKFERNKENIKAAQDALELIKDLQNQEKVETIKTNKELKKIADDRRKEEREAQLELNKRQQEQLDKNLTELKNNIGQEIFKQNRKNDELEIIATNDSEAQKNLIKEYYRQIDLENAEAARQKEIEAEKQKVLAILSINQQAVDGAKALSDLVFTIRSKNLQKGSKEEEELARKNFNLNKAFQISSTIIQGVQNGINAYGAGIKAASATGIGAATAPFVGAAFAAVSGLTTLAAVAKIASTQFKSSGGGGGAQFSPAGGGVNIPQPPQVVPQTNIQTQPTTRFDENGNVIKNDTPVKAIVVESDVTNSQKNILKLRNEASFG